MTQIPIKIYNTSTNPNPKYATPDDPGCDVMASMPHTKANFEAGLGQDWVYDKKTNQVTIHPGGRALIGTGIHCEIPVGYGISIRPRSGLALKYGISIVNSPALIDPGYRGEFGIILINHSNKDFVISDGDRVAQFTLEKTSQVKWIGVSNITELSSNSRGGGFGHTGR